MIYRTNDLEDAKIAKFKSKHKKCPGIKVIFSETGIGTKIEIKCCLCKKTKDVSDYGSW